ncbi:hypothetical protein TNCV_412251 [Trichonephila clavipes]|uniref:Uncharacterized protein n=1 Tax=Trichonephila clavipes TaxID=2585209 RepID=A0A8X6S861_TRICX|nr:hypothetical protein TNCV_412251 [Trichonephila clavipes]
MNSKFSSSHKCSRVVSGRERELSVTTGVRKLDPCHDEFSEPSSSTVHQVTLAWKKKTIISREGMDVCKRTVPFRHGGSLNSPRAASLRVKLVEGEDRLDVT